MFFTKSVTLILENVIKCHKMSYTLKVIVKIL
jgi:hypothetical protein